MDEAFNVQSPSISTNKEAATLNTPSGSSKLPLECSVQNPERRRIRIPRLNFHVNARIISDAILGLSDGLTVPFALTAGLSSFGTTRIVILGGLAELVAGAISMGLGGFIGAQSEV
jgi:hypothetical protein